MSSRRIIGAWGIVLGSFLAVGAVLALTSCVPGNLDQPCGLSGGTGPWPTPPSRGKWPWPFSKKGGNSPAPQDKGPSLPPSAANLPKTTPQYKGNPTLLPPYAGNVPTTTPPPLGKRPDIERAPDHEPPAYPFRVTECTLGTAPFVPPLPPQTLAFRFGFSHPVNPSTLKVPQTVSVFVLATIPGGPGNVILPSGKLYIAPDQKTVVLVSGVDNPGILRMLGASFPAGVRVGILVDLVGSYKWAQPSNGVIQETTGRALDGDCDGRDGGDYVSRLEAFLTWTAPWVGNLPTTAPPPPAPPPPGPSLRLKSLLHW